MMVGAPFWGRLADRIGQPKVVTRCLLLAGAMFIPQWLARSVPQLFAARLALGFFSAGIAPSLQSLIAHHSPVERRAGILGVSFALTLFGNAVGPLIGGALASVWGVRAPFLFTAGTLLVAGLLSRKLTSAIPMPPPALTEKI
jgi:MFS family permease